MALSKINFQNGTIVRSNFLNEIQKGSTFSGKSRANYYAAPTDTEQSSWMVGERDGLKDWELDPRHGLGAVAASGRINAWEIISGSSPIQYQGVAGTPSVLLFNPNTGLPSVDPYISINAGSFVDQYGEKREWPTTSLAIKDNQTNYIYYRFDSATQSWGFTYSLNGFPTSETLHIPLAKITISNGSIPVSTETGDIFFDGGFVDYRQGSYSGYLNAYSSQLTNTDIKISDYLASNLDRVLCDTSAGSFVVTLPEMPEDGTRIAIADIYGTFDQYPLVIKAYESETNGIFTPLYTINGSSDNWIINSKNSYLALFYSTLTRDWRFEDLPLDAQNGILGKFISCGGREIIPNIITQDACPTGQNIPSQYPTPSLGTYFWDSTQQVCYAEIKNTTALYGNGTASGTIKEFNAKRCMPEDLATNYVSNKRNIIYVDPVIGNDSITNDGGTLSPFRTIERAILEGARRSYRRGLENDVIDSISIQLAPGDYYVDNRPGTLNINEISTLQLDSKGLISQENISNSEIIQSYDPQTGFFIAELPGTSSADLLQYAVQIGRVIYSTSGGVARISRMKQMDVNSTKWMVFIDGVSGEFNQFDSLSYDTLYKFNPSTGGLILPRGISINGTDLRKVKIRPMFVPSVSSGIKTALFKVTGNTYVSQLTFADNRQFNFSHSNITSVEYASKCELIGVGAQQSNGRVTGCSGELAYYQKLTKLFNIIDNYTTSLEGRNDEWSIVTKAFLDRSKRYTDNEINLTGQSNLYNDQNQLISAINDSYSLPSEVPGAAIDTNPSFFGLGLPDINSARSSSPYVFNCSVRSIYGMNGMHADGSKIEGLRSMVVAQFTQVSLQVDPNAFNGPYEPNSPTADREKAFKPEYRHFGFKASNDSYIQIVSCFVIGNADHFISESGGDLSITNSCSDFGDVSLKAIGYKATAFSQDIGKKDLGNLAIGTQITSIIPAKPLAGDYISIPDPTLIGNISTGISIDTPVTKAINNPNRIYLKGYNSIQQPPSASTLSGGNRFTYTYNNGQYLSGPQQYQKIIVANKDNTSIFTADLVPPLDSNNINYFNLDPNLVFLDDKSRVFGWDPGVDNGPNLPSGRWYFRVNSGSSLFNTIINTGNNQVINSYAVVTIRRNIDRRSPDQRIYRARVKGFTGSVRRPLPGYIVQSQEFPWSDNPQNAFIIANVQDFEPGLTSQLNNKENVSKGLPNVSDQGEYILTLLPLNNPDSQQAVISGGYYPDPNYDDPVANPDSLTKDAITLLKTFNVLTTSGSVINISPGLNEIPTFKTSESGLIPVYIELRRPSLIRATNHTWEWVGYLNYDTALPSLQGNALSPQDKPKKIITELNGGRVYATGMDEDGIFRIGSRAFDLKTNKQFDISVPGINAAVNQNVAFEVRYNEQTVASDVSVLNFVGYQQVTSEGGIATIPLEKEAHLPIAGGTLTGTLNGIDASFSGSISGLTATISGTTSSTNKTTGALVVTGGVGIGGDLNVGGDIAAFATSDSRLKENINPLTNALSKLDKISGVTYNWNSISGKNTNTNEVGVLAQEILEVLPEAVVKRDNGYYAVDYEKIIPLLIEAIKELKSEVNQLKK